VLRAIWTSDEWTSDDDDCVMSTGSYVLSVLDEQTESGPTVRHYRIRNLDNGGCFILTRKLCDNIPELVEYYKGKTFIDNYTALFTRVGILVEIRTSRYAMFCCRTQCLSNPSSTDLQ